MTIVNDHIAHHKHVCALYKELLADVDGVTLHENPSSRYDSNYWLNTVVLDPSLHVKGEENAYKVAIQGAVGGAAGVRMRLRRCIRIVSPIPMLRPCVWR